MPRPSKKLSYLAGAVLSSLLIAAGCGEDDREAALEEGAAKGDLSQVSLLPPPDAALEEAQEPARIDRDPDGNPYVSGELLVTFDEGAAAARVRALRRTVGLQREAVIPATDLEVVALPQVEDADSRTRREDLTERIRSQLENAPAVESADYNFIREPLQAKPEATPNDPEFAKQWGLAAINASAAWDASDGKSTDIAIIDTGINDANPDMEQAIRYHYDYGEQDSDTQDPDGHGTHVGGIAGALTNNGVEVAGTSPQGWLWDLKGSKTFPGRGERFEDASVINAINAAANAGADVINMSIGGPGRSDAYENAVNYAWSKGVVVVAAAGNDNSSEPHYPSGYANVISVSAVSENTRPTDFTNYGPDVDVTAPGEGILSTYQGGVDYLDGTSMASPFVAGLASLLAGQGLSNADIRARIESTTTDVGPACPDIYTGSGMINAAAAVGVGPRLLVNRCAQCKRARKKARAAKQRYRRNPSKQTVRKFKRAKRRATKICR